MPWESQCASSLSSWVAETSVTTSGHYFTSRLFIIIIALVIIFMGRGDLSNYLRCSIIFLYHRDHFKLYHLNDEGDHQNDQEQLSKQLRGAQQWRLKYLHRSQDLTCRAGRRLHRFYHHHHHHHHHPQDLTCRAGWYPQCIVFIIIIGCYHHHHHHHHH